MEITLEMYKAFHIGSLMVFIATGSAALVGHEFDKWLRTLFFSSALAAVIAGFGAVSKLTVALSPLPDWIWYKLLIFIWVVLVTPLVVLKYRKMRQMLFYLNLALAGTAVYLAFFK